MNFIVVMNDTLRPDHLAAYGNQTCLTPNSARFAKEAAVFDNCYIGSFPTIPNRTDLFTGRYGEPLHPWLPLSYNELTLPELMRENGYVTQFICDTPHMIQGGHNFDWPFNAWSYFRGNEVDRYVMDSDPVVLPFKDASKTSVKPVNSHLAQFLRNARERVHEEDWTTYQTFQSAVNWLERNRAHEKFFMWIDAFDPHEPQLPPQHYTDLYDPGYKGDSFLVHVPHPEKLTPAELRNIQARYAGVVTFVDACFGRLLDALEKTGKAKDTVVVWISDHGTHLGEHGAILSKRCAYNEVARTVLIVRAPGMKSAGKHFKDLVQPADLAPTLLEMAGLPVPERMQGKSYLSLLNGGSWAGREVAFSGGAQRVAPKGAPRGGVLPQITARDQRWVLIDSPNPAQRQLFDIKNDPGQLVDVAKDHAAVVKRLHDAVVEFVRTHEAQPQIARLWETGKPGDMTGYVPVRPGCERYAPYFNHILNSHLLPEG